MDTQPNQTVIIEDFIKKLEKSLPVVFSRREVPKLLGGAVSAGTLANLGKSGPEYIIVGRNAIYERDSFLRWLRTRITTTR